MTNWKRDNRGVMIKWWSQWPGWGQTDIDTILAAAKVDDVGQMSLFDDEVAFRQALRQAQDATQDAAQRGQAA